MLPDGYKFDLPWSSDWALPVLIGLIAWAALLTFHEQRKRATDADLNSDAPVQEVFRYLILDSKWALGHSGSDDNFYTDVEGEIRGAASLKRVRVWARPTPKFGTGGFMETPFEVSSDFWGNGTFDLTTCIGQATETGRITDYSSHPHWTWHEDVRLNWSQVKAVWPKANWFECWRDDTRRSRESVIEEESK